MKEETATIKLSVRNARDELRTITQQIVVRPVTFSVRAQLRTLKAEDGFRKEDRDGVIVVLEVALLEVDEELKEQPFVLMDYSLSEGVQGVLKNDQKEPLAVFPLQGQQKHQLFLCLDKGTVIDSRNPKLTFTIKGPGDTLRQGEVDLTLAQQLTLDKAMETSSQLGFRKGDQKPDDFLGSENSQLIDQGMQIAQEYMDNIQGVLDKVKKHYAVAAMPDAMQQRYRHLLRRREALAKIDRQLNHQYSIWSTIDSNGGFEGTVLKLVKGKFLFATDDKCLQISLGRMKVNKKFQGYTALHHAIESGNKDAVKILLANRVDVDARGPKGETALLLAVRGGDSELTRLLLEAGADPDIGMSGSGGSRGICLDQQGWAPLHEAIAQQHLSNVELLLAHGADANKEFSLLTSDMTERFNCWPTRLSNWHELVKSALTHRKIHDAVCAASRGGYQE